MQKDWAALGASVRAQGAGVTAEEWKNIALFLRKVYQLGGDLEFLAGTFPSDKKKSALGLVKSIQVGGGGGWDGEGRVGRRSWRGGGVGGGQALPQPWG